MPFFLYILQSESSGRYYVGHTRSVEERVAYHNSNCSLALKA
jgi:predicted GIY-YIG superfamily endonuclease